MAKHGAVTTRAQRTLALISGESADDDKLEETWKDIEVAHDDVVEPDEKRDRGPRGEHRGP